MKQRTVLPEKERRARSRATQLIHDKPLWHADHVYKHSPTAIEACWLLTMLAYNLFEAFINLNLKPVLREAHTKEHFGRMIAGEIYGQSAGWSP